MTHEAASSELIEQLKASNRVIELLTKRYMQGVKLSRVEALQVQTVFDDNAVLLTKLGG